MCNGQCHCQPTEWKEGDRVHIGHGKITWIITGFWEHQTVRFAELVKEGSPNAYVKASSTLDKLRKAV